jgi:hypothetical protein
MSMILSSFLKLIRLWLKGLNELYEFLKEFLV